ncbi:hypothetical protein ACLOAV_006984, partial [Pseudogymnoascus australis]
MAALQPPPMTAAHHSFCEEGDALGSMKFAPFVTAFQSTQRKAQTIASVLEADKPFYEVCETVPKACKHLLVVLGGLAILASPLQNASQLSQANDWHATVLMRKGSTMWIFDPAFDLDNPPKDSL